MRTLDGLDMERRLTSIKERIASVTLRDESNWLETLSERKRDELEFHDRDRAGGIEAERSDAANRKYYSVTEASREYVAQWVRSNVPEKIVLDYACGNGHYALMASQAGARFAIGIDISPVSIANCQQRALSEGMQDVTRFYVGDCEATELADNSVDTVICSGMLHHLDLTYALPEIRRILVPGGRCLAVEALAYNPAIRLYRALTPSLRTEWESEHILSQKDLDFARCFMAVENVRYWHLASLTVVPLRRSRLFRPLLAVASAVDSFLLRVPGVQKLAWMFTFELVKKEL